MSRRYRKNQVVTTAAGIALGTADGDVLLPICAPSEGAIIDRVIYTHQVAGTATDGSYTLVIEEYGAAVALTESVATGEVDAGVGTTAAGKGTGVGATKEGNLLQIQATEVDTVDGELTVAVTIWWIT